MARTLRHPSIGSGPGASEHVRHSTRERVIDTAEQAGLRPGRLPARRARGAVRARALDVLRDGPPWRYLGRLAGVCVAVLWVGGAVAYLGLPLGGALRALSVPASAGVSVLGGYLGFRRLVGLRRRSPAA